MGAASLMVIAGVTLAAHIALMFYRLRLINAVKREIEAERAARLAWQKEFEAEHRSPWTVHTKARTA